MGRISSVIAQGGTVSWSRVTLQEANRGGPRKENYLLHIVACVGKDQSNHNESGSFFFFKGNFRRVIQFNSSLLKICRWLVKCNQSPLTF